MKLEEKKVLLDAVANADMVLIGIGEEWGISFEEMMEDKTFSELFTKMQNEETKNRMVPVMQREYLKKIKNTTLKQAYTNLLELVQDKNYFLLSMNKDKYPVLTGFDEERCVFPCGNYEYLQCDAGCMPDLLDASFCDGIYEKICQTENFDEIEMPVCPNCGKEMVFNQIGALKYVEAGYLPLWERYMKWLQGTVNKKLCLIELGVSMRFPSVIRWPFEKTTFYNQKAEFFRIHATLSQPAENIGDRCYSCSEDSVTYMANLFVS